MKNKYLIILVVCFILIFLFTKKDSFSFFNNKELTREQALNIVNNLPDVLRFKNYFTDNGKGPITGGVPVVEIQGENNDYYTIEVYEHIDGSKDGWGRNPREGTYVVNKKTGTVVKEPEVEYKDKE